MVVKEITLAFKGIERDVCQDRIIGPKILFSNNFLCSLGDDLAKQPAATNKNGVVGSNGKATPSAAKPTKNMPNAFNNK